MQIRLMVILQKWVICRCPGPNQATRASGYEFRGVEGGNDDNALMH